MTNKKILTLISFLLLFSFLMVGCMLPPINQPPKITSDPVETATVGVEYVYDVDATDANPKDVLTYSLTDGPSDMEIGSTSGLITWTPTATGDFGVTVQVSDEKGEIDTQLFTITVTPVPVAPTLATIASPQIARYGEVFTYTVVATAGTGPDLTFSLPVAPTMMSINTATGVISWTPIAAQLGYNNVTVKVTANDGLSDEASFIVEVKEPVPPVVKLTSIVVLPETMNLIVGDSKIITSVIAHYDDGSTASIVLGNCTYTYTPVPALTDIVIIIDSNGLVTAVAEGTSTITVNYTEGEITKTDTIEVTVRELELELVGIKVDPKAMTLFVGGSEKIVSVTATYEFRGYGVLVPLEDCTFLSTDEDIATVENSDEFKVIGKKVGTTTIIVNYGGKADTIEVTVNPVLLDYIVVLPETMDLFVCESDFITSVTAYYNDGTDNLPDNWTYDLNPMGIVDVDATTGKVTPEAKGETTITISYEEDGITRTDTIEVTVKLPSPVIDGILSLGEWDCATTIPVASEMGIVRVLATVDYLYVAFDVLDSTDARLEGQPDDEASININPTDGAPFGMPCDIIFKTGANPNVWGISSGETDGWKTEWRIDGVQQLSLPGDLETMTLYDGVNRVTEWKIPLVSMVITPEDFLKVGGSISIDLYGNLNYVYPIDLDPAWADASTYEDILVY